MTKFRRFLFTLAVVALSVPAAADDAELQAKIDRLEKRLAEVEAKEAGNWLNERRAEEVKALIHEVLSDADTRASLLQDGAVAGHDGKNFFLASADESFLLELSGQIQFRYIANFENSDADDADKEDGGFQVRRTKLNFAGHVTAGPKWEYEVVLALDREDGNAFFEDVVISTEIMDGLEVKFGKFKLPFLREELTSSKRQLAVDRSSVTEFFTLDRAEQVQLVYSQDMFNIVVSINDGADSEFTTIGADEVEFAITARVDVKLMGEWGQMKDYTSWSGEPNGLFLGGAVHYEAGDGRNAGMGQGNGLANYFAWTIDGSFESNGMNINAAFMGGHIDPDAAGAMDRDMYGFLVQGGYNINDTLEPFARFEWIDSDMGGMIDDEAMLLTLGANYYFKKHNAKLTVDVVILLDGDSFSAIGNPYGNSPDSDGLGFSTGDAHEEDNILLRTQFQLLF